MNREEILKNAELFADKCEDECEKLKNKLLFLQNEVECEKRRLKLREKQLERVGSGKKTFMEILFGTDDMLSAIKKSMKISEHLKNSKHRINLLNELIAEVNDEIKEQNIYAKHMFHDELIKAKKTPETICVYCTPELANEYCRDFQFILNVFVDKRVLYEEIHEADYDHDYYEYFCNIEGHTSGGSGIIVSCDIKMKFKKIHEIEYDMFDNAYVKIDFYPFEVLSIKGNKYKIYSDIEHWNYSDYSYDVEDEIYNKLGLDFKKWVESSKQIFVYEDEEDFYENYCSRNTIPLCETDLLNLSKFINSGEVKKFDLSVKDSLGIVVDCYNGITEYIGDCMEESNCEEVNIIINESTSTTKTIKHRKYEFAEEDPGYYGFYD